MNAECDYSPSLTNGLINHNTDPRDRLNQDQLDLVIIEDDGMDLVRDDQVNIRFQERDEVEDEDDGDDDDYDLGSSDDEDDEFLWGDSKLDYQINREEYDETSAFLDLVNNWDGQQRTEWHDDDLDSNAVEYDYPDSDDLMEDEG